jgi:hypothetical protein
MTPIISGEFWFKGKSLDFSAMIENGELRLYIFYNGLLYDLLYFFNNFLYLERVYAFKTYYEAELLPHISKVLDGTEFEYTFKYYEAVIHMKIEEDTVQNNMMVTRITELMLFYNEDEDIYTIEANAGNKIFKKEGDRIDLVYDKIQLTLGYYNDASSLRNLTSFVGKYIDLSSGFRISASIPWNSSCMIPQLQKTLENLMESGLVKISSRGLVDYGSKDKLLEKLKAKLDGVIREELIEELVEY